MTTFKEILQDLPPGNYDNVPDIIYETNRSWMSDDVLLAVNTPDLQLYCDNDKCKGVRLFEYNQFPMQYEYRAIEGGDTTFDYAYIEYLCQNCKENLKLFSIVFTKIYDDKKTADIIKIGEFPFFGPHIPSRLISLIGPDRNLFLNGRRCENQGLGIGAFAYYRRVIENQKNRILEEIIKVAKKLNATNPMIDLLEEALKEIQFNKAIKLVKDAIPESLLINGHNPLLLLHSALSDGLHERSDEHCLGLASSIRIVLTDLSERLAQALKDEAELNTAI